MSTIPTLPGCGGPATVRIEIYSARNGMMHGSLDGAAHSCEEHLSAFVHEIRAAGFTPFTLPGTDRAAGTRCGSGSDYTGPTARAIAAPVAAPASVVPVLVAGAVPDGEHVPSWCVRGPLCLEDAVHASGPILVNLDRGAEFASIRVWLEQLRGGSTPPVIRLETTEEGEVADHELPLDQAQLLAHQLIVLIVTAGGAR